ncbi:MAG: hypothetical protein Kow0068_16780 [Marinilabiliales bacterium]
MSQGYEDFLIAKLDTTTGSNEENIKTYPTQLIIYANPNNGKCNIKIPEDFINEQNLTLYIYDNSGKLLQQTKFEMNEEEIKLNIEKEAKGVYNVVLSNGKKVYKGKIVFE